MESLIVTPSSNGPSLLLQIQMTNARPPESIPSKGIRWGGRLVYGEKQKKIRERKEAREHRVRFKVLLSIIDTLPN